MSEAEDLPEPALSGRVDYPGFGGCVSHTHLKIWLRPNGLPPVAMVTEQADNPGTSVTNAPEAVWKTILGDFTWRLRAGAVMIECYSLTETGFPHWSGPPGYDIVTFDGHGRAHWESITFAQLRALILEGSDA